MLNIQQKSNTDHLRLLPKSPFNDIKPLSEERIYVDQSPQVTAFKSA